jgi:hypothetical protein
VSGALKALVALAAVASLAACGDRDQVLGDSRQPDTEHWQSTQSKHLAGGFKPGDEAAWDTQIRNRAQTQNEYSRIRK